MAQFQPMSGSGYGLRTDLATGAAGNLATGAIKVALATAISGSTTTYTANSTDLSASGGFGYTGPVSLTGGGGSQSCAETGGTLTFSTTNVPTGIVWTGLSTGLVFRYLLIVNTTVSPNKVLGYYDYGVGGITVPNGSTFTFTPGASHFTIA